MTADSRRYGRVPISLEVRYPSASSFLIAYTTNLSRGGLFLETDTPLPVGTTLVLRIAVPYVSEPILVESRVVWIRTERTPEGYPPGMGIQFTGLDERYGHLIDEIVAHFDGVRLLIASASPATRSQTLRYLRSILTAHIAEVDSMPALIQTLSVRVDLAILDCDEFPDPEGALVTLVNRPEYPVPVIALSNSEMTRMRVGSIGAAEALLNPPSFGSLQQAVIRCLSKPLIVSRPAKT